LPARTKDPGYPNWQHLRLTPNTLDVHFPLQQFKNIGILNGIPSTNHLDADLDCPQTLGPPPKMGENSQAPALRQVESHFAKLQNAGNLAYLP